MNSEREYHRGDVFLAHLGNPFGSEQGGLRPVVIMQNDFGCTYSPTVTMVPLTSNLKKVHLASHYVLQDAFFLKKKSMVLGEQIETIDKHRLHTFLGRLSEEDMIQTAEAVKEHLGFISLRVLRHHKEKRVWKEWNGCCDMPCSWHI